MTPPTIYLRFKKETHVRSAKMFRGIEKYFSVPIINGGNSTLVYCLLFYSYRLQQTKINKTNTFLQMLLCQTHLHMAKYTLNIYETEKLLYVVRYVYNVPVFIYLNQIKCTHISCILLTI